MSTPDDSRTSMQPLGQLMVHVTYLLYPGCPPTRGNMEVPDDPGEDGYVEVLGVLIDGRQIGVECFADRIVDICADLIFEEWVRESKLRRDERRIQLHLDSLEDR